MLFDIIRFVLLLTASVFVILKIRKSKIVRKKLVSFSIIALCFVLIALTEVFPVENIFIDFKSPEKVFYYTDTGEINDVLYGKESCVIIYSDRNTTCSHCIIPKTENGYKIPGYFSVKRISHKFDRNGNFDVYNVSGTDDYYVIGTIISNESDQVIADSRGAPVENIAVRMGDTQTKTVITYSYVENFTNDYYLVINGIKTAVVE